MTLAHAPLKRSFSCSLESPVQQGFQPLWAEMCTLMHMCMHTQDMWFL